MDRIVSLCENPLSFPVNLTHSNKLKHALISYNSQVIGDRSRLFCEQCAEGLTFWDFSYSAQGKLPERLVHVARVITDVGQSFRARDREDS